MKWQWLYDNHDSSHDPLASYRFCFFYLFCIVICVAQWVLGWRFGGRHDDSFRIRTFNFGPNHMAFTLPTIMATATRGNWVPQKSLAVFDSRIIFHMIFLYRLSPKSLVRPLISSILHDIFELSCIRNMQEPLEKDALGPKPFLLCGSARLSETQRWICVICKVASCNCNHVFCLMFFEVT